jgi:magnesium-transporting ATPase (P-type)
MIFTEISVFLFEDATLLNIWIFSGSFDKSDIFDRMNAWVTLLSVLMCIIMFVASLIFWLRLWIWKDDLCSRVCQVLSAISFLAVFGVIVVFLLFLVFYGFQTIASDDQSDQSSGGFIIVVCVCWMFASFFACTLRQRARVPQLGPTPAEVLTIVCDQQDDTISTVERSIDDRQDVNDLVEQDDVPFCFAVSVIADEEVKTEEVSV